MVTGLRLLTDGKNWIDSMTSSKIHCNDFLLPTYATISSSLSPLYNLVILNSPTVSMKLIKPLWQNCHYKLCADGGANRLFDIKEDDTLIPNAIVGDLDSLRSDVNDYFSANGCKIIKNEDQDTNDLDKTLLWFKDNYVANKKEEHSIIIVGGTGGRLDQQMANIDALYRYKLLEANVHHKIQMIRENNVEGPSCGIIPLGNKVQSVKTIGLKWNLNNEPLEFGSRISTSNCPNDDSNIIEILCSDPVVWTCDCNIFAIQ